MMNDQSRILRKRIMKLKGFWWFMYSGMCLRFSALNRLWLKRKIHKLNVHKLHVGCGNVVVPGWLNMTYEKREEYGRLKQVNGAIWLNYKLPNPLPLEDESLEYIAGSHFIEHLDLNEGLEFFQEAFRVMKRNGVIHISCPDLDIYVQNYVRGRRVFFEHPAIREACTFKNARTFGSIFIAKAYDSGGAHKWFYDFETMKDVLERCGFRDVKKTTRLESRIPQIERIELAEREVETLYVEAVKP